VVAAHVAARAVGVASLGDDLEVGLAVEQHPQAGAHDLVVVCEHDADRLDGLGLLGVLATGQHGVLTTHRPSRYRLDAASRSCALAVGLTQRAE